MIKVGVLFGGKSIEREVSFNSGRTICDHLDTQLFKVIPIFQTAAGDLHILPWSFLYRGKIADFEHRLAQEAQKIAWDDLPSLVDFVYIATHGKYAEDGRLQAILELLKIPYLGSKVFASALGMNKTLHNHFLQLQGITIPKGFDLSVDQIKNYDAKLIQKLLKQHEISFPVIIKPANEGSSFGVFCVHDQKDLQSAVQRSCFISGDVGQNVLIEEKIEGMEFCCMVITDISTGNLIALPPTEVVLADGVDLFDYRHKYMPGVATKRTPPACSAENIKKIQDTCIATMRALEMTNIARFDGFLTRQGDVIIIDSNTLTGMAPSSFLFRQAAEIRMGHAELINHLIKTELKNYRMERQVTEIKDQKKIKIAVLFGGASNEKEISLESGRNVCYKLSPEKYEVMPMFVDSNMQLYHIAQNLLVCTSTKELTSRLSEAKLVPWSSLKSIADFAFLALHGGQGENGVVQGTLEMLEIPYNGPSIFASSLCIDKFKTGQFLKAKGFDVPQALLLSKKEFLSMSGSPIVVGDDKTGTDFDSSPSSQPPSWDSEIQKDLNSLDQFMQQIKFPCIVKPHDDGCSVMVASPKNKKELILTLEEIFKQKDFALIEERLTGMELTVGVVGNQNPRALAPSQAIAKGGVLSIEEKFLPGAGENQTPAHLSKEDILLVQRVVRDAYVAIGCVGYSRIDCFFQSDLQSPTGKKRVVILEFNTLPGLTPATCLFHQAAEEGLRPMELLDEIIELGLQAHRHDGVVSVDAILQQHQESF
jgi:D-alanine-D-alanine ligase